MIDFKKIQFTPLFALCFEVGIAQKFPLTLIWKAHCILTKKSTLVHSKAGAKRV